MWRDSEFDYAIFKKLTKTDTGGDGASHQGGFLVPKALGEYFPEVPVPTKENPAPSIEIEAALYLDTELVGVVTTRYQHQTWAMTRTPERRVTGNLGPLMSSAVAGDYLLIERSLDNPLFFRLTLLPKDTTAAEQLRAQLHSSTFGPIDPLNPPNSTVEIAEAQHRQLAVESERFSLFDNSAALKETRAQHYARSTVFRQQVAELYSYQCVLCKKALRTPDGKYEAEAAHIIPRGKRGADDARNGLLLCRSHHWAFDMGLFGFDSDRRVVVPKSVADASINKPLLDYVGQVLPTPNDPMRAAHDDALAWHLKNIVGQHK